VNVKVWQIRFYPPTARSPDLTLLECKFARWSCRDKECKACSFQHLPSLLQPSEEETASPGVLQHRPNQKKTHGLHPQVPSLHLLQGRMSQEDGSQHTALMGRETLDGLRAEDYSPNLGRKQESVEQFTAPYLLLPKLGASSTRNRSEGKPAILEAKSL